MTGINITSSGLYKKNTKYKLSSIINEDNLLYCITNKSNGKIESVNELPQLERDFFKDRNIMKSIFEKNNLINDCIDEFSIGILSPDFTFLPAELHKKGIEKDIFSAVSIKQYYDEYDIKHNFYKKLNSYFFFLFPIELMRFSEKYFTKVNFFHANEIFIENYDFITSYDNLLLANLNENHMQTAVYKDGKFVRTNVYSIKTKEDILYNLISLLSDTGIPLNKAEVLLSGRLEKDSVIYRLLYEHIKNISFISDIPRLDFSNIFLGKPKHLFFDIYALSKCE